MLLTPRDLQRPRPQESLEEALWPARGPTYPATSRSAETASEFSSCAPCFAMALARKKGYNRTLFLPGPDPAQTPRIFSESDRKKQLPPPVAGSRQAGRQASGGGGVVVAGGVWWWLAGVVHGG